MDSSMDDDLHVTISAQPNAEGQDQAFLLAGKHRATSTGDGLKIDQFNRTLLSDPQKPSATELLRDAASAICDPSQRDDLLRNAEMTPSAKKIQSEGTLNQAVDRFCQGMSPPK
ncbi:MAG: hypothetical protein KDJ50_01730 [Alphaproteobacteria bacterium]|nr:hypothetical protein [Alphaproteobacteria bacterium]